MPVFSPYAGRVIRISAKPGEEVGKGQTPSTNTATQILLKEVASVNPVSGASFIYREQQQCYLPIKFSVRGRNLGSTVLAAQRKIADEVTLLPVYRLEWAGELGKLQDAVSRLKVIIPITLLLISVRLYFNFGSQVQRPLVFIVVGGILLAPALVLLALPVLIGIFSRRGQDAPMAIPEVEPVR